MSKTRISITVDQSTKDKLKQKADAENLSVDRLVSKIVEGFVSSEETIENGISILEDKIIDTSISILEAISSLKNEIKDEKHQEVLSYLKKEKMVLTQINPSNDLASNFKIGDILIIDNEKTYLIETILDEENVGIRNIFNDKTSTLNVKEHIKSFKNIKRLL